MPLLAIAVVALVIVLSIHVCRTGRSRMWLPVIWVLPVLGSIIYVLVEMVPQLFGGEEGEARGRAKAELESLERAADIEIERRLTARAAAADTDPNLNGGSVHARLQLAEACLLREKYDEAAQLFAGARQGFFANSPDIIHGLARAHFGRGDMATAIQLLDELVAGNASYQPHAVMILKARALAKHGDAAAALSILESLLADANNLKGRRLEAQYRYAEILWQQGEKPKALAALTEILRHEKLFRVSDHERHWIQLADQAMKAIA